MNWVEADIIEVTHFGTCDIWHDRAIFHSLTEPAHRSFYFARFQRALRPGHPIVLGTFGLDGPGKCSGLADCRYDALSHASTLGLESALVNQWDCSHVAPAGKNQRYAFGLFRKSESTE